MGYYRGVSGMMGDPGFSLKKAFKIPKGIRKLKPGKIAMGLLAPQMPIAGPAAPTMVQPGGGRLCFDLNTGAVSMGDPFLGGLIGGAARLLPRAAGLLGLGGPRIPPAAKAAIDAAKRFGGSGVGRAVIGGAVSGVAGGAIARLLGGGGGAGGARGRRMNPGNVKALRRSIRRVESFRKLAMSTIRLTKQVRVKKRRR